ncbi:MAG TPA: helix-turn-helix domain-containing protein [Gammaproteobacteria bacterium]|nr:helix-turn-helix domain-containing protein [Gammaproteobacteria bacterium]
MTDREGVEFSATTASRLEGPGAYLRKIREEKKIELDEMAKQLRFTPQRLVQLENDDYSTMGSSTFARGYLRTYARLLGMSETEVGQTVALFDSQGLKVNIRSNTPQLIHEKMAHSNHKFMRGFSLLVILIVVILAGFWWHNRNSAADKMTSDSPSGSSQEAVGVNPNPPPVTNSALEHPIPLTTTPPGDNGATPPASAAAATEQPQATDAPSNPSVKPAKNTRSRRLSQAQANQSDE